MVNHLPPREAQSGPLFSATAPVRAILLATSVLTHWTTSAASADPIVKRAREVVVSASRYEQETAAVGSSVTVLYATELLAQGKMTVSEALAGVTGLDAVQTGGRGGDISVGLRGLSGGQTLVLIDGVEINNPIVTNRAANLSGLGLTGVERIEIIRGPQSTLYGADAVGGVINIISKRGEGPARLTGSVETGAYRTTNAQVGVSGSASGTSYSLSGSQVVSEGFSAASPSYGNTEADGIRQTNIAANIAHDLGGGWRLSNTLRALTSRADIDNFGGDFGDDPNRIFLREDIVARSELATDFLDGAMQQTFAVSFASQGFTDNNDFDPANALDMLRSDYDATLLKLSTQNTWKIEAHHTLVTGVETQEERGDSRYRSESFFGPYQDDFSPRGARTTSAFVQISSQLAEGLSITPGVRLDRHSDFGSEWSYRGVLNYRVPESGLRTFASAGTGFKAPSLYQLYSSYGSRDLEPEKSFGTDIGVEYTFEETPLMVSVTGFKNRVHDLISFDNATFKLFNTAVARTRGIEMEATVVPSARLSISANATYLDSEDENGDALLRRPTSKASVQAVWKQSDRWTFSATATYTGQSIDTFFGPLGSQRTVLHDSTLISASAEYGLNSNCSLYVRGANLLDSKYEQVYGYGVEGAVAFVGVRFNLG